MFASYGHSDFKIWARRKDPSRLTRSETINIKMDRVDDIKILNVNRTRNQATN